MSSNAAPDANQDSREYDEAVEALRRGLCALPRFSFLIDEKGNVQRVPDPVGRWIDWMSAHELFDPEVVDALIAKYAAGVAIKKASGDKA
jgi:hypothetical protein